MFPNQFHSVKMKNNEYGSLVYPRSSARWLEPQTWHSKVWTLERIISCLSLSFSFSRGGRQSLAQGYGNPSPYRV